MFHDEFRPPLWIEPGCSRRLACYVILTHLLALFVLPGIPAGWLRTLLAPVIGASLIWQCWAGVWRRAPWSIQAAIWHADGTWQLVRVSGAVREARLTPATFVSPALVVLNFRESWWRRAALPLFADALDPELLRRLRQRLGQGAGAADQSVMERAGRMV